MARRCKRSGSCCAGQDIYDAKTVADRLGIAHYVLDYESRFRDRRDRPFRRRICARADAGALLLCNQGVKFTDLIAFARELGADCLATGHYVRRVVSATAASSCTRAPTRAATRAISSTGRRATSSISCASRSATCPRARCGGSRRRRGSTVADKPDSQDICFVPDGDYAGLVKKLAAGDRGARRDRRPRRPGARAASRRGPFHHRPAARDRDRRPGRAALCRAHRAGDAAAGRRPAPRAGGRRDAGRGLELARRGSGARSSVKVRSLAPPVAGEHATATGCASQRPNMASRPGQAAVFYDGDAAARRRQDRRDASAAIEARWMPPPPSAGILLFRRRNGDTEVLLVKPGGPFWRNRDTGAWMIPKGHGRAWRNAAEAALREFEEETGTRLTAVPFALATVRQAGGKTVEASRSRAISIPMASPAPSSRSNGRRGAASGDASPRSPRRGG